jgi:hypothetical protein
VIYPVPGLSHPPARGQLPELAGLLGGEHELRLLAALPGPALDAEDRLAALAADAHLDRVPAAGQIPLLDPLGGSLREPGGDRLDQVLPL